MTTFARLTVFSLFLSLATAGIGKAESPSNSVLLEKASSAEAAFIRSLEEMVNIESGSGDYSGLAAMTTYVENRLKKLGAATTLIPLEQGDKRSVVRGIFHGKGKLRVLMIAHMDTVYARGTLKKQPFQRVGNQILGPGIADDKGGIAMILHAMTILKEIAWDRFETITVLINPNEEIGSGHSGPMITEHAKQHDMVLSYEPGDVRLGTSGISKVVITVHGESAHASIQPAMAKNALLELVHLMDATRDVADDIPGVRLNWTIAKAGSVSNQIPDIAVGRADVRITDPADYPRFKEAVRRRIEENRLVAGTTVEVEMSEGFRPMLNPTPEGRRLATLAQSIMAELPPTETERRAGKKHRTLEIIERGGGGTDAGFAAQAKGVAVIEGFGAKGGRIHSPEEYIDIEEIAPWLYLNTRMLVELGKGKN